MTKRKKTKTGQWGCYRLRSGRIPSGHWSRNLSEDSKPCLAESEKNKFSCLAHNTKSVSTFNMEILEKASVALFWMPLGVCWKNIPFPEKVGATNMLRHVGGYLIGTLCSTFDQTVWPYVECMFCIILALKGNDRADTQSNNEAAG